MGKDEVDKAKKVFKDAWDALNDFFDESDLILYMKMRRKLRRVK